MPFLKPKALFPPLDVGRKIDELFSELIHKPWGGKSEPQGWQPAVDLYATPRAYVLEADLPGVLPENIELTLHGNMLQIRGHRQGLRITSSTECVSLERAQGEFVRQFQLTSPVDLSRLETDYENGIFRAMIPKVNRSSP